MQIAPQKTLSLIYHLYRKDRNTKNMVFKCQEKPYTYKMGKFLDISILKPAAYQVNL